MAEWVVDFEVTVRGTCMVEAESASAAVEQFNRGEHLDETGVVYPVVCEMVDWDASGATAHGGEGGDDDRAAREKAVLR